MNRKTKMGYNAEAKWLIWQKLILSNYCTHTVVYRATMGTLCPEKGFGYNSDISQRIELKFSMMTL